MYLLFQEGNNTVYFTLDKTVPSLNPTVSTAQFREQQLPDIPGSVQVLTGPETEGLKERDIYSLIQTKTSADVSGWTPFRPDFSMRGIADDQVNSFLNSRISLTLDDVPLSGFSPAST